MDFFSICKKVIDGFRNTHINIFFKILALVFLTFIIILNLTTPTTAYFVNEHNYNETLPTVNIHEKEDSESVSNDDESIESEYEDSHSDDSDEHEEEKKKEESNVKNKKKDDSNSSNEDDNKEKREDSESNADDNEKKENTENEPSVENDG